MEQPEMEQEQVNEDAVPDTATEGDASTREGASTVMPEQEAEHPKRTPSPPPGGSGPDTAPSSENA